MSILDVFRLRPIIGIHRELRRLNENFEAFLYAQKIMNWRELAEQRKEAAAADRTDSALRASQWLIGRSPEERDAEETSDLMLSVLEVRRKQKAGEWVDPEQILAIDREMKDIERLRDENIEY